ncbi:hypothetical protein D3C86_1764900 [compost metagenome]
MVNVDRLAIELAAQLRRQHLHVARKDHQFGAGLFDDLPHLTFLGRLVVRVQREVVVRNLVPVSQWLEVRVVGDHRGHVHRQLADALAIEQIVEAVIGLGDHDHHFRPIVRRGQFEDHAEGFATLGEPRAE